MKEYKTKTLVRNTPHLDKGREYYCSIKSVTFNPKRLGRTLVLEVKKGEIWWWKLFGKIPVIPFKAKENLYRFSNPVYYGLSRYGTRQEIYDEEYAHLKSAVLDGNKIYFKPSVEIELELVNSSFGRGYDVKFFETDKEAASYFTHIENMCAKYGNSLKNKQKTETF